MTPHRRCTDPPPPTPLPWPTRAGHWVRSVPHRVAVCWAKDSTKAWAWIVAYASIAVVALVVNHAQNQEDLRNRAIAAKNAVTRQQAFEACERQRILAPFSTRGLSKLDIYPADEYRRYRGKLMSIRDIALSSIPTKCR